jgi:hypothetical protein
MMKKLLLWVYTSPFLLIPFVSFAQAKPRDFKGLVDIFLGIMQTLVVLIFALTFITVVWKVVQGWIIKGGEAEGIEAGKNAIVAGIIGLVVMSSIWGILYLLRAGFFGG